jgi:outer membrane protein assembly factor BamB
MVYRDQPRSDLLVVALRGVVVALDRTSGREVWRNELEAGGLGAVYLVVEHDLVFASAAGSGVFALEYATGATRWTASTTGAGRATILVEDDAVFVAKGGYLDCFGLDGQPRWKQELSGLGSGPASLAFPGHEAQADTAARG